jgi:GNAT superfamily N-acetyltransferase
MANVVFHKSTAEFFKVHKAFLDDHYYLVYPLLELIVNAKKDNLKISAAFSFEDGDCVAIGIQAGPFLTLYSTKWNEEVLSMIEQTIPFEKMGTDIFFSGTYDLIKELLNRSGKEYKEISARNVYECRKLTTEIPISSGELGRPDFSEIERIADLSFEFQKEEYGERNPHDREYMLTHVVEPGIINGSIVKWMVDGEVVSIAQVMIDEEDKPIIGHFFTDPAHRGKGYGTSLIWCITNAIFRKVGYELKYRWLKASFC